MAKPINLNPVCTMCEVKLNDTNRHSTTRNLLCKKCYASTKNRTGYSTTERGKKARLEASKRAYQKHREKWITRAKTRYAVKQGILIKPKKCEVCEQTKPLQAHHHDYTKHLEVIWLCTRCHTDEHLSN